MEATLLPVVETTADSQNGQGMEGWTVKQQRVSQKEKGKAIALGEPEHILPDPRLPRWKLKGCPNCGGDMYRDGGEYTCLYCGRKQW